MLKLKEFIGENQPKILELQYGVTPCTLREPKILIE